MRGCWPGSWFLNWLISLFICWQCRGLNPEPRLYLGLVETGYPQVTHHAFAIWKCKTCEWPVFPTIFHQGISPGPALSWPVVALGVVRRCWGSASAVCFISCHRSVEKPLPFPPTPLTMQQTEFYSPFYHLFSKLILAYVVGASAHVCTQAGTHVSCRGTHVEVKGPSPLSPCLRWGLYIVLSLAYPDLSPPPIFS